MQLRNALALVTGAGRRIGREIAIALAQGGADVVLHTYQSSGEETQQPCNNMAAEPGLYGAIWQIVATYSV